MERDIKKGLQKKRGKKVTPSKYINLMETETIKKLNNLLRDEHSFEESWSEKENRHNEIKNMKPARNLRGRICQKI